MPHRPTAGHPGASEGRHLKVQQALQLRAKGKTYENVAAEMGISETYARDLVKDGVAKLIEENKVTADEMRQQIVSRLEWAASAISPKVEAGDVYAIEKWVMIQREIAKLYGVAIPVTTKNELEVTLKQLPAGPGTVGERIAGILAKQAERQLEAPGQGSIIDVTASATTVDATSVREITEGQDH